MFPSSFLFLISEVRVFLGCHLEEELNLVTELVKGGHLLIRKHVFFFHQDYTIGFNALQNIALLN